MMVKEFEIELFIKGMKILNRYHRITQWQHGQQLQQLQQPQHFFGFSGVFGGGGGVGGFEWALSYSVMAFEQKRYNPAAGSFA